MSRAVKKWLIAGATLVILGLILFAGMMAAYDWDFTKLSTVKYVTNTYEVEGGFDKISINVDTTKIELVPTEDKDCSIVCFEAEKVRHTATVQNDTLVIDTKDTRKWYDYICFSIGTPKMTVYLPQNEYASLFIETDTGDIKVNSVTAENDIQIETSTGAVKLTDASCINLVAESDTGDIKVNSVTAENDIKIETGTGAVKLTDASCINLVAESDTGDITLKNVVARGSLCVESNTGDVRFEDSDATQISVKTSTGDVIGRLLSEKVFITKTSTGRISVPKTTSGGKCEITTSTGDIKIDVTP